MAIPRFSERQASEFAQAFGINGDAQQLASYSDQNFRITDDDGSSWVLKIANSDEPDAQLSAQSRVMNHLHQQQTWIMTPCPKRTLEGDLLHNVKDRDGELFTCRMVDFIAGDFLGDLADHSDALLRDIGRMMGELNRCLRGFDTGSLPARALKWDLARARDAEVYLDLIGDRDQRALVGRAFEGYRDWVEPLHARLPVSLIHNDGNDFNILIKPQGGDWRAHGLIDFGDMVVSQTINDLAITQAYALLNKDQPLRTCARLVEGFNSVFPLTEIEIGVLFPLICARLATSVCFSAEGKKRDPDNSYLTVSERPAWRALAQLNDIHPKWAEAVFRQACGFEPNPSGLDLVATIQRHRGRFKPVIPLKNALPVDLGPTSRVPLASTGAQSAIADILQRKGAKIGYGGYLERRRCYTGPAFQSDEGDMRNVHLGLDIFAAPGTPVTAPLAGRVHSCADHNRDQDYGPTVILRHELDRVVFYTLYGHLSRDTLAQLQPGQEIQPGQAFAWLGDESVNGGWVPHLHFQVIHHLLRFHDDFPGTANEPDHGIWASFCPDPAPLAGLPEPAESMHGLVQRRRRLLGPSLSLAYDSPLHIVRGKMQYLIDARGRHYLDCVNNVAHVGHCHPRVVHAAAQQLAKLNTNTRYLHETILEFAESLLATFPEQLDTCFFVNSGSEANDLARRLAASVTGTDQTVVIEGGYHGNLSALIEISPYKHDGPGGKGAPSHVYTLPMPDPHLGHDHKGDAWAEDARSRLNQWAGSNPLTFICEAILSCGGQVDLPPGTLSGIYPHIRQHGGICIADEVQIGFGRVGTHFWGFQRQSVVPDIVTLGKPIGNGHPLAAVVTRRAIAESFDNGMEYFNTFGGNPVSCAIGLEVLRTVQGEGLQQHAHEVGDYAKTCFRQALSHHDRVGDIRGSGLFLGIEFVTDRASRQPDGDLAANLVNALRERGILISRDGPAHNVIKIKPPMPFSTRNAEQLCDAIADALQHV